MNLFDISLVFLHAEKKTLVISCVSRVSEQISLSHTVLRFASMQSVARGFSTQTQMFLIKVSQEYNQSTFIL